MIVLLAGTLSGLQLMSVPTSRGFYSVDLHGLRYEAEGKVRSKESVKVSLARISKRTKSNSLLSRVSTVSLSTVAFTLQGLAD